MQLEENETLSDFSYSADELGQYKSLSIAAVLALVMGLLSSLVFVSPLLIIFPLAALGAAGLALIKIDKSAGSLTGKTIAHLGLALAVAFTSAAYAKTFTAQYYYDKQIESVVIPWLQAVANHDYVNAKRSLTVAAVAKIESADQPSEIIPLILNDQFEEGLKEDKTIEALHVHTSPKRLPEIVEYDISLIENEVAIAAKPPQAASICEVSNSRGESLKIIITLHQSVRGSQVEGWEIQDWRLLD